VASLLVTKIFLTLFKQKPNYKKYLQMEIWRFTFDTLHTHTHTQFILKQYQGCSFRPSNVCVDNSAFLHPCNFTFNPSHPLNFQTHSYCLQMCLGGGGRYGKKMLPSFGLIHKWPEDKTVQQQRYNPQQRIIIYIFKLVADGFREQTGKWWHNWKSTSQEQCRTNSL